MSISKQEAERCYPTQYWNGKSWPLKLLSLTTDDLQLAYQSGREAEPCKEQVEAVAKTLAVVSAYPVMPNHLTSWCGMKGPPTRMPWTMDGS